MRSPSFKHTKSSARGVSLVEVMVSVFILSIGLLGIAAMQATGLSNNQSSLERTQAIIHSYSIMDSMRTNLVIARAGGYNIGLTCAPPGGGTLATNDITNWITAMQASNQGACGMIEQVIINGVVHHRVTVQWNDSRATGGSATQTVATVGRL